VRRKLQIPAFVLSGDSVYNDKVPSDDETFVRHSNVFCYSARKAIEMEDVVIVAEVEGHRAAMIVSVLESHDLTVFVENESSSNMLPFLAIPVKIRVPKEQVARAQEVLQSIPPESENPEGIELED
jgi:hypothetical protein